MSHKTRRSSHASIVVTTKRLALRKIHVACAAGLFALAPSVAAALELGLASIRSRLGEPLVVEIPYRLAAGELLTPACVGLVPGASTVGGSPRYTGAGRVAITPTHIEIFGESRVLEPLIGVTVGVQCASAPRFVRSYELFVDPPSYAPVLQGNGTAVATAETLPRAIPTDAASAVAAPSAEAPTARRAEASPQARGQTGSVLAQGQSYVVVRGDTLSGIAARVSDRPGAIRATADAIFAANPQAFARGNPDLIQAGRSITIPTMAAASAVLPVAPEPVAEPEAPAAAPAAAPAPQVEAELPIAPVSDVAQPIEPVSAAQSSAAPASDVVAPELVEETRVPTEASALPPSGGPSLWLTVLLALGGAIGLSVPLSLLWRPKREAAPRPEVAKPRAPRRRQLVDPTAGIDVVEGELPRALVSASASPAAALDFDTGALRATDSVDLDVGTPTVADERVDQSGDRTATLQQTVTLEPVDDKQHTLTIAELDVLRADYEAEHTLTQEGSKTLRDALADLKASEAAHAAGADTATLEMPESETIETQPTRRLRAAR